MLRPFEVSTWLDIVTLTHQLFVSRRMESLIVVPISKVSAQQRAGRAGRTGEAIISSGCCRQILLS